MISHQDLLAYWPSQEDVVACVKTDAEAASEAVSLAVHHANFRRVYSRRGFAVGLG